MGKNLKLLVLERAVPSKDLRIGGGIERNRVLNAISSSGAKIRHDSGGRLVVIETSDNAENILRKSLIGARLVPVEDVKDSVPDLDPTESLFLEALKIRNSKGYRDAKKLRKFGETPEEKKLFTGSCVREEY